MKNINKANVRPMIRLQTETDSLLLETGIRVIVKTDKTDFKAKYEGEITLLNEDGIEIDDSAEVILWEYIKEITIR